MRKNKDSLPDLIDNYKEIYLSSQNNNNKAINYRKLIERVLKYVLDIERDASHSFRVLKNSLRNHPDYFKDQLNTKLGVLYSFYSRYGHDNPVDCSDNELEEHRQKLVEFFEKILDERLPIIEHNTQSKFEEKIVNISSEKTNDNELLIKPGFELRHDFQININWVGQNRRFAVRFNRGKYQDQIFYYDHDEIYEIARDHLETLPSFINYGYNLSTVNIPKYAIAYLI